MHPNRFKNEVSEIQIRKPDYVKSYGLYQEHVKSGSTEVRFYIVPYIPAMSRSP